MPVNDSIWLETIDKKPAFQFELIADKSDEITLYDSKRDVINKLNSIEGKWKETKGSDKDFKKFAYGSWLQKISN